MALALELENLDAVPEHLKTEYTERDGKYFLNVDGELPDPGWKDRVTQLNKENEKRRKQLQEMEDRLKEVDLEEYKALKEKAAKAEEERMILEGKQEELANKKLELRDAEWKKQLALKDAELEAINSKVANLKEKALQEQIRSGINGVFHAMANDDAVLVAMSMFKLDDNGNAVMYDEDGAVVIGKDGKTPFSPREWANSDALKDTKPHWFAASLGGTGATQTQGSGGGKTMSRAHFMTLSTAQQAKIMRDRAIRVVDK